MEEKIKSVFLGKVTRNKYELRNGKERYSDSYYSEPYIHDSVTTVKREKISESMIENLRFSEKQTIFIPEINKYTTIESFARSTDGSIYYNVSYVIESLGDTEESFADKKLSEEQLTIELDKYNKWKESERIKCIEKSNVLKEVDYLYLNPSIIENKTSLECLHQNKKITFDVVSINTIEKIFTGVLNIKKDITVIRIDCNGIGTWMYSVLKGLGYNVEQLEHITKIAQGSSKDYWI